MRTIFLALSLTLALTASALAAEVQGSVTDRSGGALEGAVVRILNVATGQEVTATADASGRFRFPNLRAGIYRVAATFVGFSDASRTVVVTDDNQSVTLDFELQLGAVQEEVTVSAARGERDEATLPLRTDAISARTIHEMAPVSTGDALAAAPGVTVVGSGPFQVRPRLRGLDSTRVLVLVDGERLNNARTATDRAGVEVGLVDVDSIEHIEVLGGAGSVLYGTDALSGTINIITNRARFSDRRLFTAGFDGFYSSNENGRRGTVVARHVGSPLGGFVPRRRRALRQLRGGQRLRRELAAVLRRRHASSRPTRSTTTSASTSTAFPNRSTRRSRGRAPKFPSSGMDGSSANLSAIAQARRPRRRSSSSTSAAARRRRLSGLRSAVLLPGDHAAVEPAGQDLGDLLGDEPRTVVAAPDGDAVLPAAGSAAPQPAAGAVPGADGRDVLPDQRVPAEHPERHAAAGVDARRRRAGHVPDGASQRPHRRRDDVSRSQRGRAHEHDDHDDDRPGGARRARSGRRRSSRRPSCSARRRSTTRCACRTRRSGTSACSCTTSGT